MPLESGGWARVTYSVYTWAVSRGLHRPWTWAVPQQDGMTPQVCATRDGFLIGLDNEMRRMGIAGGVQRV
jgi:hypothetical protein